MSEQAELHLFEGYGIELEYMIVDSKTLNVHPVADKLLKSVGGGYDLEVELGDVAWSNELALHVIEMKTNGPAASWDGLAQRFQGHVTRMNELLQPLQARLLPTAMHPWMNPDRELKLWPHENDVIYSTFDRIFDCRGHGWANLQSTHINLPFCGDEEFGRLHAAIRLVLPLVPGLAASSPFVEGKPSGHLDTRLTMYRDNAKRVPSVSGKIVPEPVFTQAAYESELLGAIYKDLETLDPQGILRHEWVNARGCIARFDRMAIEIRLLDIQECPAADIAMAAAISEVVRAHVGQYWCGSKSQRDWEERELAGVLAAAMTDGDQTVIENRRYLDLFGFPGRGRARMIELWQHLFETVVASHSLYSQWQAPLETYVQKGCLARRLLTAFDPERPDALRQMAGELADCLQQGRLYG